MAKARAGFHGPEGTGINQLIKGMGGPEYIVSLLDRLYRRGPRKRPVPRFMKTPPSPAAGSPWRRHSLARMWTIADGHSNDAASRGHEDIAAFLMWAAEPKMMARKEAGFRRRSDADHPLGPALPDQQEALGTPQGQALSSLTLRSEISNPRPLGGGFFFA